MNAVRLVAVFAENKPGKLARATQVLANAGINIRCVTIATTDGFGVLRFLVDQCDLASQKLKRHGFTVSLNEVLAIEVEDRPGGLYAVAHYLAQHRINAENASGFVSNHRAVLLIEVADVAAARRALEQGPFRLLTQEEMLKL